MNKFVIAFAVAVMCSTALGQELPPMQDLVVAIDKVDVAAVRTCLNAGAPVKGLDKTGISPLVRASMTAGRKPDALEIVDLLLQAGADIDKAAPTTPLDAAARQGLTDVVSHLLDKGANINCESEVGKTPLYHSIRTNKADVVALLIQRGAKVNTKTAQGWSPLHLAVQQGMESTVQLLLQKGAFIDARDNEGYTPLDWAKGRSSRGGKSSAKPELLEFLIQSGAKE
jgi:ankyrin repeat protein